MRGKLIPTKDGPALQLFPRNDAEKAWLRNAFDNVRPGTLTSNEGVIESLVLWTDYKLPVQNNPVEEQKGVKNE